MENRKRPTYGEQKAYYDRMWDGRASQKLDHDEICRLEFITSSIEKIRGKAGHRLKIIDLGCGRGWITDALSRYGKVIGVDLSVDTARKLYPGLKFTQANIVTGALPGKYDIVVSSEVIEHLSQEDQRIYVRKAYDLLKEPGFLVLTTPNKPKVETLVRELSISREQLQPIENWLDKESLRLLLNPYFKVISTGSTVFHPVFIRKRQRLNFLYSVVFDHFRLYKVINMLFGSSTQGLYLTAVARKRISQEVVC